MALPFAVPVLLLLALAAAGPALALDPAVELRRYVRSDWDSDDGLPQNSVQSIVQTRDGFLWLATQEGLARFDGRRFDVFDRRTHPELANNFVRALFEDRRGALWIGTQRSLCRRQDGALSCFSSRDGLGNETVTVLNEDARGDLWVGTMGGLHGRRGERFVATTTREGLSHNLVRALYASKGGAMWVGTEAGLDRAEDGRITSEPLLAGKAVTALWEDRVGRLWVGTRGNGLGRLEKGALQTFSTAEGLPDATVTSLLEDRDGTLWVGTMGGLARFRDGRFERLGQAEGLSNDFVMSLREDAEGSLWVGTAAGLNRLWESGITSYGKEDGLPDDVVMALAPDGDDGSLWVGTVRGLSRLRNGTIETPVIGSGKLTHAIGSVRPASEGALWVTGQGVLHRDGRGRVTWRTARDGLSSDLTGPLWTARDGSVWVGTFGAGLNRLRGDRVEVFTREHGLPSDTVHVIREDRAGRLWVGTKEGLAQFDGTRFVAFGARDGLSDDPVMAIHEDGDGSLWIGTRGGGLVRFKDGRFSTVTRQHGLFEDVVFGIVDDGLGRFWLAGNRGISRVSREELIACAEGRRTTVSAITYGTADGMRNSECNGGAGLAAARTPDGRLWFATAGGLVSVDPKRMPTNALPPPVAIVKALVRGQAVAADAEVEPGEGSLEFHYSGLSFRSPGRVRFRYRLDGFDQDWVDAGTRRVAYFTNIPPGDYTFRVTAANEDGVWNPTGAAFAVRLPPRFYESRWFHVACILGIAALVGLAHRVRVARLQAREKELARRVEETLATVKVLSGLLPMCAWCKNIRDDQGYWQRLEAYIADHSQADFSHGICPDCMKAHYPDFYDAVVEKKAPDGH